MLNLTALLTGDLNRLRYMTRFSTAHVNHKENVAEHSYYVVLYAYLICCHLLTTGFLKENSGGNKFVNEVLVKALLHDCEECVTGDMPRPFKYGNSGVKALLDQAASWEVYRIVSKVFPNNKELWEGLQYAWGTAKKSDTGAVVALADFLSVLSHMLLELQVNNWTMQEHFKTTREYLSEFESSRYYFLRDIITQAKALLEEAFERTIGLNGAQRPTLSEAINGD